MNPLRAAADAIKQAEAVLDCPQCDANTRHVHQAPATTGGDLYASGLVKKLEDEFNEWAEQSAKPNPYEQAALWKGPSRGPVGWWPNVESFLKDKYPAAHKGFSMGMEDAQDALSDPDGEEDKPWLDGKRYETGPEAVNKYGYDPSEIAAALLLLHNATHPGRDWLESDLGRITKIFQKRMEMNRAYEQRTLAEAKDALVTASRLDVYDDATDRLRDEFHQWWDGEKEIHDPHGYYRENPLGSWRNIEKFFKAKYPEVHRGMDMGLEQARPLIDQVSSAETTKFYDPYLTGEEAIRQYGYDPKEVAARMLFLHNRSHPGRLDPGWLSWDTDRIYNIVQQRHKQHRHYEDALTNAKDALVTASRVLAMPAVDAYDKSTPRNRRYDQEPEVGPWYHSSDQDLPVGAVLTPSGGPSRFDEYYDAGWSNRKDWVWVDRNPYEARMWNPTHLYRVEPMVEGPWLWNRVKNHRGEFSHMWDGYVTPKARIVEKIDPSRHQELFEEYLNSLPEDQREEAIKQGKERNDMWEMSQLDRQMRELQQAAETIKTAQQVLAMPAPAPKGLRFEHHASDDTIPPYSDDYRDLSTSWFVPVHDYERPQAPMVTAYIGDDPKPVGFLRWKPKNGEVGFIWVSPLHRSKSIASEMFDHARGVDDRVHHSADRTTAGDRWVDYEQSRRKTAMPAPAPKGLRFEHVKPVHPHADYLGRVEAYVDDHPVGHIEWLKEGNPLSLVTDRKPGEVSFVFVHPNYRRHSIATEMFDWAKKNIAPDLHHSQRRTDLGEKWIGYEQGRELQHAAAAIRQAQQVLAKWYVDPEYFIALHEMGHVLDTAGGDRASMTIGKRLEQEYAAQIGKNADDDRPAYGAWLRTQLPGRAFYDKDSFSHSKTGDNFNAVEAVAAVFAEHEINPEASTPLMKLVHQHLIDESRVETSPHLKKMQDENVLLRPRYREQLEQGNPRFLPTFRPDLPRRFVDGVQDIVRKYPQSAIVRKVMFYDDSEPPEKSGVGWANQLREKVPGSGIGDDGRPDIRKKKWRDRVDVMLDRQLLDPAKMNDAMHSMREIEGGDGSISGWMWQDDDPDDALAKAAVAVRQAQQVLAAKVNQDVVNRLDGEFKEWVKTKGSLPVDGRRGPIGMWVNIEKFLHENYPAAYRGLSMGQEHARPLLDGVGRYDEDGHERNFNMLQVTYGDNVAPYETGPEAVEQHGYDPREVAAAFLLLHNRTHPLRGYRAPEDQARLEEINRKREEEFANADIDVLHDIVQKRHKQQQHYDLNKAAAAIREAQRILAMPQIDAYDPGAEDTDDYLPPDQAQPRQGKWYHVSPTKLEVGSKLTPGGGDTPWIGTGIQPERHNWVWMDDGNNIESWQYGMLASLVGKGQENPWVYLYEVQPDEGPYPWNGTGQHGHVSPSATVVAEVPTGKYNIISRHRIAMPAPTPEGLRFTHDPGDDTFSPPSAQAWLHDRPVGKLTWYPDNQDHSVYRGFDADPDASPGKIHFIQVDQSYRRHGIGTALFDWAKQNVAPNLQHSDNLTGLGSQWAQYERHRTAMPAPPPEGLHFKYHHTNDSIPPEYSGVRQGGSHTFLAPAVAAYVGDEPVGYVEWWPTRRYPNAMNHYRHTMDKGKPGEVYYIYVNPKHRRHNIATMMFDWAKQNAEPDLHHSPKRSELGKQWIGYEEGRDLQRAASVIRTAQRLLAMPDRNTYSDKEDPTGAPPGPNNGGHPIHAVPSARFYDPPDDGPEPYPGQYNHDVQAFLQAVRENPEAMVRVYRAVPANIRDLNKGDWVSPSRNYVREHSILGTQVIRNNGWPLSIVSTWVPASSLYTYGFTPLELGYHGEEMKAEPPTVEEWDENDELTFANPDPLYDLTEAQKAALEVQRRYGPLARAAMAIREASTILAKWKVDPNFFAAVHEMAHVLDAVSGFRASDTIHEVLVPMFEADTGKQMSPEPGGHWVHYGDWLRSQLPGRAFEQRGFSAKEAIASAFVEHEIHPEASTPVMKALHQHVVDHSAKAGRPTNLTTFRPFGKRPSDIAPDDDWDSGKLPRAFMDGVQHIFTKYPQSRIVDMVEPLEMSKYGPSPVTETVFGNSWDNKPRIEYDDRASIYPDLVDDSFRHQFNDGVISPWMWENDNEDTLAKAAAVLKFAEPMADAYDPNAVWLDDYYPPDKAKPAPAGKWYHVTPHVIAPGTRLTPKGGKTPFSYQEHPDDTWLLPPKRQDWVWMDTDKNAQSWLGILHMNGVDNVHVYEVTPEVEGPWPYNGSGREGYVSPAATVVREIPHKDGTILWDEIDQAEQAIKAAQRTLTDDERRDYESKGWRGQPCEDPDHHGVVMGRCAECGSIAMADEAIREAQKILALTEGVDYDDTAYWAAAWDDEDDEDDPKPTKLE